MSNFPISREELLVKLCHVGLDFIEDEDLEDWLFTATELILCGWLDYECAQYMMRDAVGMLVSVWW